MLKFKASRAELSPEPPCQNPEGQGRTSPECIDGRKGLSGDHSQITEVPGAGSIPSLTLNSGRGDPTREGPVRDRKRESSRVTEVHLRGVCGVLCRRVYPVFTKGRGGRRTDPFVLLSQAELPRPDSGPFGPHHSARRPSPRPSPLPPAGLAPALTAARLSGVRPSGELLAELATGAGED